MFAVFHKWLANFPEELLTIALTVIAGIALYIAFFGQAVHKAVAVLYFVFP
jgi:hypothetical protein